VASAVRNSSKRNATTKLSKGREVCPSRRVSEVFLGINPSPRAEISTLPFFLEDQEWKVFSLTPTKRIHAKEILDELPTQTHRNLGEVMEALKDQPYVVVERKTLCTIQILPSICRKNCGSETLRVCKLPDFSEFTLLLFFLPLSYSWPPSLLLLPRRPSKASGRRRLPR